MNSLLFHNWKFNLSHALFHKSVLQQFELQDVFVLYFTEGPLCHKSTGGK